MNREEIISSGLVELYALGSTTTEESTEVETGCVNWIEVRTELNNIELAMEQYADANAVDVSPSVKEKLLKQLDLKKNSLTVKNIKVVNRFSIGNLKFVAAASAALLVGSTILNFVFFSKYKNANENLEQSQLAVANLNQKISDDGSEMNIVRSKYSLPLKLKPDVAPKEADAKIYWLTNTGEIYIDPSNLPPTPKGMQYQLWAIVNGKAIDGGLIVSKDGKTLRMQKMKTFGKADAFAVTLEKEGGVLASKEKPYVIINL